MISLEGALAIGLVLAGVLAWILVNHKPQKNEVIIGTPTITRGMPRQQESYL